MRCDIRILAAAALVVAFSSSVDCYNIREDELLCEEAVAHVDGCCVDLLPTTVSCRFEHHGDGCDSWTEYPELDIEESKQLSDASCEQLQSQGVCERAALGLLPESRYQQRVSHVTHIDATVRERPVTPAWSCIREAQSMYGAYDVHDLAVANAPWAVGAALVVQFVSEWERCAVSPCVEAELIAVRSSDEAVWSVASEDSLLDNERLLLAVGSGSATITVGTSMVEVSFELTAVAGQRFELAEAQSYTGEDPAIGEEALDWPVLTERTLGVDIFERLPIMPNLLGNASATCGYPPLEVTTTGVATVFPTEGQSTFMGNWPLIIMATAAGAGSVELRLGSVVEVVEIFTWDEP